MNCEFSADLLKRQRDLASGSLLVEYLYRFYLSAMKAHVSKAFESKAQDAGADFFISKPFDLGKIKEYLHSCYED